MASLIDAFADFVGSVKYREVERPWGKAQVWDTGEGRPVVLLHGIAAGRRVFFRLVPELARKRRVIVPPLRGEDLPAPGVTLRDLTDDLGALLDALDVADVTLFGVSFGGMVALAYAARRDPRVREIVVQGTFLRFRLRPLDRVVTALSRLFPADLGAAYYAWRVRRGPECRLLAELTPGLDTLLAEWSRKTPFATLRRRIRIIGELDLEKEIAVPLTLVHGGKDRVVPRVFFERLQQAFPEATQLLWEDVGHNVALTHPEKLAALLA